MGDLLGRSAFYNPLLQAAAVRGLVPRQLPEPASAALILAAGGLFVLRRMRSV